jgi:hypothetical protein
MVEIHLLDRRQFEAPQQIEEGAARSCRLASRIEAALFIDHIIEDLLIPKGAWR